WVLGGGWEGGFPPGPGPGCWPVAPAAVMLDRMSDVTRLLSAIEQGDPSAAAQLLPLVYDELRQLAAQKLAHEQPGQPLARTHRATTLIHEASLPPAGSARKWGGGSSDAATPSHPPTARRWCPVGRPPPQ